MPDAASPALIKSLEEYGSSTVITLSSLLARAGWDFDPQTGLLEQCEGSDGASFLENAIVCNRITRVSKTTVSRLDDCCGVLNIRLALAAYELTLQKAGFVLGGLCPYPAGHILPLNLQWRAFAAGAKDIATPNFVYGFGSEEIDTSSFREPVWKSIFDLYTWQGDQEGARPELHKFVVDKPLGIPVMVYFVDSACSLFPLHSGDSISISASSRLRNCAKLLQSTFKWFMGEALFYLDQDKVVFAACSPLMTTSACDSSFQKVVSEGTRQALKDAPASIKQILQLQEAPRQN